MSARNEKFIAVTERGQRHAGIEAVKGKGRESYLGITTCSLLAGKQPIRIPVRRSPSHIVAGTHFEYGVCERTEKARFFLWTCIVRRCRLPSIFVVDFCYNRHFVLDFSNQMRLRWAF